MDKYAAIKNLKVGSGKVVVEGVPYEYDVISRKLAPALSNFVGFPDSEYLFVSEDVPEKWRFFVLSHEVRCFALRDMGLADHCKKAVEYELRLVPADQRSAYLEFRCNFFLNLAEYYKNRPSPLTAAINESRDFLLSLS